MSEARRRRGRQTELFFAKWLQENGWPYAEPVGSAALGADITGTPGIAFEVKARTGFEPLRWLRQARSRPGVPIVILRCNGQGPAYIGEFGALLRIEDLVPLLRAAGYGDPLEATA